MPSTPDFAFIVLLALLLFGPKKLPVLARQLGKLMADFRRASNEFRAQMEEELRISEQAERQKKAAELEAARPTSPTIADSASERPDLPYSEHAYDYPEQPVIEPPVDSTASTQPQPDPPAIATAGELSIQPPATGLPLPKSSPTASEPIAGASESQYETETLHG